MTAAQVFGIASPIAMIVAIGGAIAGIIFYLVSKQVSESREAMRKLKLGLEQDPSPAQLAEALRNWPAAGQYPATQQLIEFRKQAQREEALRADRNERVKGTMRFFCFLSFLGVAVYVAGIFLGPKKTVAPANTLHEFSYSRKLASVAIE